MSGRGMLVVVTGSKGSGKSRFLTALVDRLRQAAPELDLRGLLSPAVWEGERKVGIEVVDLASGERRQLARPKGDSGSGPSSPHWAFEQATIDWANELLAGAADAPLLVIDELGWLEFEQGEGFTKALELLDRRAFRVAVVTIRSVLLARAGDRWPIDHVIDLEATEHPEPLANVWCRRLLRSINHEKGDQEWPLQPTESPSS